jgi:uncharacterized protein (TIGR02594 family)
MPRKVASLTVCATVMATVSSVAISVAMIATVSASERFKNPASSSEPITSMAPAQRVAPTHSVDAIQRSDGAAILMPTNSGDNLRPTVSNTVDTTSSMGRITTSSVSKLVLDSVAKTTADHTPTKSGENNPLLEALRWKGANSVQVGVPSELWCADFMNFILGQTGQNGTGSRAARSFLKYGKRVDGPRVGAIVVLTRNGGAESGHVGIVRGTDGEGNPIVISGNHGKRVAESIYKKEKVLGYFMPPNSDQMNATSMNAAVNNAVTTANAQVAGR